MDCFRKVPIIVASQKSPKSKRLPRRNQKIHIATSTWHLEGAIFEIRGGALGTTRSRGRVRGSWPWQMVELGDSAICSKRTYLSHQSIAVSGSLNCQVIICYRSHLFVSETRKLHGQYSWPLLSRSNSSFSGLALRWNPNVMTAASGAYIYIYIYIHIYIFIYIYQ